MDAQVYRVPPAQVEQYDYCIMFPLSFSTGSPTSSERGQNPNNSNNNSPKSRLNDANSGRFSPQSSKNNGRDAKPVDDVEAQQDSNLTDNNADQFDANIKDNEDGRNSLSSEIPLGATNNYNYDSNRDALSYDALVHESVYYTFSVSDEAKEYISRIVTIFGRYYVYQYDNIDNLFRIVLIRGSVTRMKVKAEKAKYKMLLDEQVIKGVLLEGDKHYDIEPIYIPHNPLSTKIGPFQYIYTRYRENDDLQEYYWRPANLKHPFRNSTRIHFILKTLEESEKNGGIGMNLRKLKHSGIIICHFPLHSLASLATMEKSWIGPLTTTSSQPLFLVKEYFGDNIGIYFTMLEHLSESFLMAAVLGIIFQSLILAYDNYNLAVTVAYGIFNCLWYTTSIAFWKRKEKVMSLMWGTLDNPPPPVSAECRPEFKGVVMKSLIDGSASTEYDIADYLLRAFVSTTIWLLLVFFSLSVVIGIYIAKYHFEDGWSQWVASIITGVWIVIMNSLHFHICKALVNYENHRLDSTYNRSLQVKVIILQFVNSYATIYFLAFLSVYLKGIHNIDSNEAYFYLHKAGQPKRMSLLAINLVTIFGMRSLKTFLEIVLLYFITKRRVGINETRYDLIDPMPPTPPIPNEDDLDGKTNDIVDIDYDDTYAGNSPSNRIHVDAINPAMPRKKSSRRRLSSLYTRRSSYEYTAEVPKGPEPGHDLDKFGLWSSFRNNSDKPSKPAAASQRYSSISKTPSSRDQNNIVEDDSSNITPVTSPVARPLGAGTYVATRNNYDVSYREMNRVERDYELKEWNPATETIKLYSHLLITFGYVAIFGCLLPGISLLAVLDLYLLYKKDAFRFINVFRRLKVMISSNQYDAEGTHIGSLYYLLFNTFLSISFVTNALLIIFTMTNFDSIRISIRLWIFIAINGTMFGYRHLAMLFLTKEPSIVNIQRLRTNFICKQLIEKIPDEEADPTSIL